MTKEIRRHTSSDKVPCETFDLREADLSGRLPDLVPGVDQFQIHEDWFAHISPQSSMMLDLPDEAAYSTEEGTL